MRGIYKCRAWLRDGMEPVPYGSTGAPVFVKKREEKPVAAEAGGAV